MSRVSVALGERSYEIDIGPGRLGALGPEIAALGFRRVALVTNPVVEARWGRAARASLEGSGIRVDSLQVPDGEEAKSLRTLESLLGALLERRLDRTACIVALGGGVVGDLAGFAAAVYQRGIAFVQVPTTLLAQVDSSVGGKTGVNHRLGKNMIGAFWQPRRVLIDTDTLSTLPPRELRAGFAEVAKYGLIRDAGFFSWLEGNLERVLGLDPEAIGHAIEVSCRTKAAVVGADERETGERALLNLGHTFGHAIEAGLGYGPWLHGEAVAAGMVLAARFSQRLGWLATSDVARVEALLARAGLPVEPPALGAQRWLELMGRDKKVAHGQLRLVLLRSIGDAVVTADFDAAALEALLP